MEPIIIAHVLPLFKLATQSEGKKSIEAITPTIKSQDVLDCSSLEDWRNNDLALVLNEESNVIELKEDKKSGLFYFERSTKPSFVIRIIVKPIFNNSPNLVFYFDPMDTKDDSFRVIVGDGEADVVKFQYFMNKEWHTVEDQDKKRRLPQPIASDENITVRIETSPNDGTRTTKIKLTYKPGNNPNADIQVEYFNYPFPVKRHPPSFNFALGLINPQLISDKFSIQFLSCSFQEMI